MLMSAFGLALSLSRFADLSTIVFELGFLQIDLDFKWHDPAIAKMQVLRSK